MLGDPGGAAGAVDRGARDVGGVICDPRCASAHSLGSVCGPRAGRFPVSRLHGPEFTATLIRLWLDALQVQTLFIEPGSPWENGYDLPPRVEPVLMRELGS